MEDGNALRLDCNTEVTLRKPEVVEVNRGRLYTICQPAKGLEITSGGGTIVTKSTAQVAVECQPQATRLIVIDGEVKVRTGQGTLAIGPGKQVRIVEGRLDDAERCDTLLETGWVNGVLALRSSDDPELADRVNRLLASVGAAKLSLLYEDELRRLGDGGVPPLLAYLNSTRNTPNVAQRATAARIVADVAEPRWVADLIALLTDANADVRFHAARAGATDRPQPRRSGRNVASRTVGGLRGAHEKWLKWWQANRDRYPAARATFRFPRRRRFNSCRYWWSAFCPSRCGLAGCG